jgi:DNA invertase Pin-like site-specific DNA recombinase
MNVATYSRVSTNKREQKPEVQVQELRRYCKARKLKVTHEIVDRAKGGTDDRQGFKQLLKLVRAREVDAVVVVKLDRLFRSLKHLVNTLSEFEALGVKFIATHDQVDLTTPAGRMFVQILGSLAEFERELIRERIFLGLDHARRQGKRLGRPKQNDDQAVQKLRRQGLSYQAIQRSLGVSKGAVCRALQPPISR